jgi:CRP-like cAMP-binding protein
MKATKDNLEIYLQNVISNKHLNDSISSVLESFSYLELNKNDFFVEKGNICKHLCYIETGILHHSIPILGEEKTTYLAQRNSLTSALNSFKNKVPSRKNIKALSDCKLWVVNIESFNNLIKNNKAFYKFYYNLIENQIFLIDDYRIDLLTLTPEERYKKLLTNEPKLLQQVPLHYLASFLGISSRHMSRIRKNIK